VASTVAAGVADAAAADAVATEANRLSQRDAGRTPPGVFAHFRVRTGFHAMGTFQQSMASSINKRNKEKQRQERRREKELKRQQRRDQRETPAQIEPGVDPDIAGIIPGPQPTEPEPT